jgi:chemotaxis protein MotB
MLKFSQNVRIVITGLLVFFLCGCTVIFQKGRASDVQRIQALEDEVDRLAKIKADLESQLKGVNGVSLSMEDRGLVITFLDEILFDSGKADVKNEALSSLEKVAGVIVAKASDFSIGVEGHTDNEPIKASGWKSNWELSSARANSIVHVLIGKGVSPSRLAAIGYGEHRPVAPNDSPEGRRKNRRVEIVILPRLEKVPGAGGVSTPSDTGLLEPKENLK